MSRVGYVALAGLLMTGIVRAASEAGHAPAMDAAFSAAALAAGVPAQNATADMTPVVTLAALVGVKPGASAPIAATGKFPAGSTFSIRGQGFTLSNPVATATSFKATVAAAPGLFPSVADLVVVSPGGKRGMTAAVYVPGAYVLDAALDNGWKVRLTTEPLDAQADTLKFAVDFFKPGEAKPFQTLDGSKDASDINPIAPSIDASLNERMGAGVGDDCAAVMKRMEAIGKMMGGGQVTPKVMAEYEKVSAKYSECTEKMVAAQMAEVKKMSDPNWAKEQEAKKAAFGCHYMRLSVTADGTATGSFVCGKDVGERKFRGSFKSVGP